MNYILETLGKIGFEWHMGLFNLINFLVVFWLLKKFAFKPIMKVIDERQSKMTEGMENYEKSKTDLQMAEKKAQDIIDNAKVEANKIVENSHQQAVGAGEQMKKKAKEEIELLIAQAKKNIEIDRADMRDALRRETIELVVLAVEKIIHEKLNDKKDEKYIKDILASLK
ncbi:MAG: ATP synthase F0 subunit B [Candidatus Magasanikbacteria bacterium CG11_big_fil_rev_8_21_14_0_20_39_34]|uniref:ATP synthase subunit b n=1 Tax=Candidatus Magasanikbacteria bacterium CG11_big_fil_rev_8_21_14_0_20_39_34 TaxID=1974653 RepID=A0A2H0N5G4_9BACT|nr:MAG: ATP synthase F0 subunit B [Candidatus Magasanikbacteria bacterium CG11_big_fil_rev_8_21_14_0_20_39_34]